MAFGKGCRRGSFRKDRVDVRRLVILRYDDGKVIAVRAAVAVSRRDNDEINASVICLDSLSSQAKRIRGNVFCVR